MVNARSLKNKLCDFNYPLAGDYLAVSVTESWLNSSVTNAMIDISGRYYVHRNDRLTKQGGGVLCLVTNKWPSFTVPIPEKFRNLDIIVVTILTDIGPLRYITVYCPPEFNKLGRKYMALLVECLEYLSNTRNTIILVGDLNLPNIDWTLLLSPDDSIQSAFVEFCVEYGLYQFVDSPTRDHHILDLVLSSDYSIVFDLHVIDTFSTSDHCMVQFNVIVRHHDSSPTGPTIIHDFANADYEGMASLGPFHGAIVVPCHALSLSSLSSTSMHRRHATVPLATSGE